MQSHGAAGEPLPIIDADRSPHISETNRLNDKDSPCSDHASTPSTGSDTPRRNPALFQPFQRGRLERQRPSPRMCECARHCSSSQEPSMMVNLTPHLARTSLRFPEKEGGHEGAEKAGQ